MGPNNDPPTADQTQNAKDVGVAFTLKYYKGAVQGPDGVMELFGDNSVYVDTNGKEARGLEEIRTAIGDLNLQEGKIVVVSMNAAFTDSGGIMVQVVADYLYESDKYGFSEAFHLVPQTKGWYVRSCLFKWHAEIPDYTKNNEIKSPVEEPANVVVNGHADDKKPETEAKKPAHGAKKPASEAKKHGNEAKKAAPETKKPAPQAASEKVEKPPVEDKKAGPKVTESKDHGLTNGTSTPPSSPVKPVATSQADSKPAASATPTSWAACVGGSAKPVPTPAVNTGGKPAPATNIKSASDAVAKSPTSKTNNTSNEATAVEGTVDRQNRNRKPARAKSDFTVHVSKIVKGQKANEKDVIADLTKAFQEFGPIAHVRVPGRRLADENETTLYAFVDFQDKKDFENMFAERDQDHEGRVKVGIKLPILSFDGEVVVAQNHDRGRMFHRNRRASDNQRQNGNGRPFNNRRQQRNNGPPGNRPPQTGNRNHSNNRRKENGTVKPKV
jgi:hypothetical protein